MKRIISLLLLLGLVISLVACQAAPKSEPQAPQLTPAPQVAVTVRDYFSSTPGSYWNYQGAGNEFASFKREVLFAAGDQAQFKESNGGTESTSIYNISNDTIRRVFFSGETYNPQNLLNKGFTSNDDAIILKAPLQTGSTWTSIKDIKKILDSQATVQTPAGTFQNCIKLEIKTPDSTATVYEYYGKGIGLIKREFVDGSTVVSSSLQAYKIVP